MQKKIYNCQRGHILLQTLIIMPILVAMLFLPLCFSVVQHKRSVINDILDKSLQRAAVEGGLSAGIRQSILDDMQEKGFDPLQVVIEPAFFAETFRGEIIDLTISAPGNAGTLKGVEAIGASPPPDTWMITATGSIMSEKIP